MTGRHLISTESSLALCHKCHGEIINALDEGLTVVVERVPLLDAQSQVLTTDSTDLAAEIQVWLADLDTYVHTLGRDLVLRTPERVHGRHPSGTIHAAHVCGPINLLELVT